MRSTTSPSSTESQRTAQEPPRAPAAAPITSDAKCAPAAEESVPKASAAARFTNRSVAGAPTILAPCSALRAGWALDTLARRIFAQIESADRDVIRKAIRTITID